MIELLFSNRNSQLGGGVDFLASPLDVKLSQQSQNAIGQYAFVFPIACSAGRKPLRDLGVPFTGRNTLYGRSRPHRNRSKDLLVKSAATFAISEVQRSDLTVLRTSF